MADAEQEQQQRALGPLPHGRGSRRGDQHQAVDLELTLAKVFDPLLQREEAAQTIGDQEEAQRREAAQAQTDQPTRGKGDARADREDQFGALTEDAAVRVVVTARLANLIVGMLVT